MSDAAPIDGPALGEGVEPETDDFGMEMADDGTETTDAGLETADPGAETADAGTETADVKKETADAGTGTADTGLETADAGAETANPGTELEAISATQLDSRTAEFGTDAPAQGDLVHSPEGGLQVPGVGVDNGEQASAEEGREEVAEAADTLQDLGSGRGTAPAAHTMPPKEAAAGMRQLWQRRRRQRTQANSPLEFVWAFGYGCLETGGVHYLGGGEGGDESRIMYTSGHTGIVFNAADNDQVVLQGHRNSIVCSCVRSVSHPPHHHLSPPPCAPPSPHPPQTTSIY